MLISSRRLSFWKQQRVFNWSVEVKFRPAMRKTVGQEIVSSVQHVYNSQSVLLCAAPAAPSNRAMENKKTLRLVSAQNNRRAVAEHNVVMLRTMRQALAPAQENGRRK